MAYLVGPKGQIVIAKEIRDHLGIKPGWIAIQQLVGDRLEVHFLPAEHRQSLMGCLAKYTGQNISSGDQWEKARQAAWDQAASEKDNAGENVR
jgi:bifunctional DNA-binding transcriptional regulator/antitoxin component of YhaV-PrlF toxin-antitoxin module